MSFQTPSLFTHSQLSSRRVFIVTYLLAKLLNPVGSDVMDSITKYLCA